MIEIGCDAEERYLLPIQEALLFARLRSSMPRMILQRRSPDWRWP